MWQKQIDNISKKEDVLNRTLKLLQFITLDQVKAESINCKWKIMTQLIYRLKQAVRAL